MLVKMVWMMFCFCCAGLGLIPTNVTLSWCYIWSQAATSHFWWSMQLSCSCRLLIPRKYVSNNQESMKLADPQSLKHSKFERLKIWHVDSLTHLKFEYAIIGFPGATCQIPNISNFQAFRLSNFRTFTLLICSQFEDLAMGGGIRPILNSKFASSNVWRWIVWNVERLQIWSFANLIILKFKRVKIALNQTS